MSFADNAEIKLVYIGNDPSVMRKVVQRRIDASHRLCGFKEGSVVCFDDSAYAELTRLTGGNISFARYVAFQALTYAARELGPDWTPESPPYTITGNDIRRLGITYDEFANMHDMGYPLVVDLKKPI